MSIKLFFIFGLVLLYPLFAIYPSGRKYYFLTAVFMTFVRKLDVPELGTITPSTIMFWTLMIADFPRFLARFSDWAVYFIYLFLSLCLGMMMTEPSEAFEWCVPLFNVMIIAILAPIHIRNDADFNIYTKLILAVSFVYSFTCIIAFMGYYDGTIIMAMEDIDTDVQITSRIYGITFSNLVQTTSIITICLLTHLPIKRYIKYFLILVFIYGGLITLKRMSFIAMGMALFYFLMNEYKNKQYVGTVAVTAVVVFLVSQWWDMFVSRFSVIGPNGITEHSAESRVDRIDIAIATFEESPLFGMGAGYIKYVHNGFMEILANCGIIGVLCIFMKYLAPVKGVFNNNPWSVAILIFVLTCFSLESAINHEQIMYPLGLFMGGYVISKNLNINYKRDVN